MTEPVERGAVKIPVEKTTVDLNSGQETTETVSMDLMPPPADACPVCGNQPAHSEEEPHNALSLYYQYAFYGQHGRWPTWADAVAHCSEEVRIRWEQELRKRGLWSE